MSISYKHIQSFSKGLCYAAVAGVLLLGYLHVKPAPNSPASVKEYQARLQENFERKRHGVDKLPIEKPRLVGEEPTKNTDVKEVPPVVVATVPHKPPLEEAPRQPKMNRDVLAKRAGYLSFPPKGLKLGEIPAKVFYPLQQRYADVSVQLVFNSQGIYIYGAGMYEMEKDGKVLLIPCVFMQEIPFSEYSHRLVSPLEQELSTAIQISKELEFYPWARYATSHLECQESSEKFRISIQFGNTAQDVFISLAVPFTIDDKNALFDLADKSEFPCSGIELFFDTLDLSELLLKSLQVKNKYINKEITIEE